MYVDGVIVASVLTVLVMLWGLAFAGVYLVKHIDVDAQKSKEADGRRDG